MLVNVKVISKSFCVVMRRHLEILSRDGQQPPDKRQRNWTTGENGVMNGRIMRMDDLRAARLVHRFGEDVSRKYFPTKEFGLGLILAQRFA